MRYGLSVEELELQEIEPLPDRNTMGLVTLGNLTLLNGLNILNNNNIGVVANIFADNNDSDLGQKTTSNDIITCVVGGSFAVDKCHD